MPLTERRLRALKSKQRPYKVADQHGLYIEVTPSQRKLWRFRYRIGKVEKKLSIGCYPEIGLRRARALADEARRSVSLGGDPAREKRTKKFHNDYVAAQTFDVVAREYIEQAMLKKGHAQTTIANANILLEKLAPAIGRRPISAIEPFEIFALLRRIQATGDHELAKECLYFAKHVFRHGLVTARCEADPTRMLKGLVVMPRLSFE